MRDFDLQSKLAAAFFMGMYDSIDSTPYYKPYEDKVLNRAYYAGVEITQLSEDKQTRLFGPENVEED